MRLQQYQLRYICIAALCCINIGFSFHLRSHEMFATGVLGLCYIPFGLAYRRNVALHCGLAMSLTDARRQTSERCAAG